MLVDYIGAPAMLEQTAEECVELAHACLKYVRYLRGENKVHGRTLEDISENLHEEIADIKVCIDELEAGKIVSEELVESSLPRKIERMKKRLEAEKE